MWHVLPPDSRGEQVGLVMSNCAIFVPFSRFAFQSDLERVGWNEKLYRPANEQAFDGLPVTQNKILVSIVLPAKLAER